MTIMDKPNITETDAAPKQDEAIITVTPMAASKIRELIQQRELGAEYALRVFVAGGGCSGLSYGMAFENNIGEFDTLVSLDDEVRVVVDATSLMYLQGAEIDFVDSLMGGGFRIENPNATSSCGCGSSFRTEDTAQADASGGGCGTCSSY